MLTAATHLLLRATVKRWFERDDVPAMRRKLGRMQSLLDPMPKVAVTLGPVGGTQWIGGLDGPGPATLYCHGGGYIVGGMASHGPFCARFAAAAGGPVLFVDYRLAPEHPHPAALEDVWNAWRAVADRPGALWLAGDSAGGALALAVAQRAVTEGGRLPERLLLISPWADFSLTAESLRTNAARDPVLSAAILERMRGAYFGGDAPAEASPLAADMRGLPPVRLVCSDSEVLRDDSRMLAERLRRAGVDLAFREFAGQPHIFPVFKLLPAAGEAVRFLTG